MNMLVVRCPKCRHQMKYQPSSNTTKLRKKCVYCGHTFTVKTH